MAKLLSRSARRRLPELSPYLDLLPVTEKGTLERYPGSPALAQAVLREQDTLQLYELHPEDRATLDRALNVRGDRRVETFCADGYRGLLGTKPKGDAPGWWPTSTRPSSRWTSGTPSTRRCAAWR
ncbi:MAG: 23S rRNA (adenine(2030)-N(6))-methyltransferase RlmJ [Deltaproteobacteria bacterium]|nr:23S rRNA (adenine(2030)-N(6))-methyltransferase RlmJ [Deltaproteobacteria bacterium]